MFTALLVAQLCIDVSWAARPAAGHERSDSRAGALLATNDEEEMASASRGEGAANGEVLTAIQPHTKDLDAQSLPAFEDSTALLGVNQTLEASRLVQKDALSELLATILKTALNRLELQIPEGGTVTIQQKGVTVGCVDHGTTRSTDTFHATRIVLKLEVVLNKLALVVPIGPVEKTLTVDGTANAVVSMPSIVLKIRQGQVDMATMPTDSWSLDLTSFKSSSGLVSGALEGINGGGSTLGNIVLKALTPIISKAIEDNVQVYTDTVAAKAAMAGNRAAQMGVNTVGQLTHHVGHIITLGQYQVPEEKDTKCK